MRGTEETDTDRDRDREAERHVYIDVCLLEICFYGFMR